MDGLLQFMFGFDKFSINGWKYMDITVNVALKDLIDHNNLWIGGNDFTISGIYFLHDSKGDVAWADRSSEVRSSYVYHNYLDLSTGTSQTVDIVFSDAITKFHAVDGSSSEVIPVYTGDSNIPDGPINDAKQNNYFDWGE